MNKTIKKNWIKALRSGDYTQCKTRLRDNGNFCCLGVLGDVAPDSHWHGQVHKCLSIGSVDTGHISLNAAMCKHLGISINMVCDLQYKNDNGSTFIQIADWIEDKL